MKAKTVDGVRRAVFTNPDVALWYRMLDSLVDYENIERDNPMAAVARSAQRGVEAILTGRFPQATPPAPAPDGESDADN